MYNNLQAKVNRSFIGWETFKYHNLAWHSSWNNYSLLIIYNIIHQAKSSKSLFLLNNFLVCTEGTCLDMCNKVGYFKNDKMKDKEVFHWKITYMWWLHHLIEYKQFSKYRNAWICLRHKLSFRLYIEYNSFCIQMESNL